jgi:hypothetical protein
MEYMEVLIKILGKNYYFAEMIGGLIVIVQRMNVSFIQNVFHL